MGSPAMTDLARSWRATVSVLLIVLVLAISMGMVCHHHDQCSAGTCTLCHMVIAPPSAVIEAVGLVPVTAEYVVLENSFVSLHRANDKPPRAPPV